MAIDLEGYTNEAMDKLKKHGLGQFLTLKSSLNLPKSLKMEPEHDESHEF